MLEDLQLCWTAQQTKRQEQTALEFQTHCSSPCRRFAFDGRLIPLHSFSHLIIAPEIETDWKKYGYKEFGISCCLALSELANYRGGGLQRSILLVVQDRVFMSMTA